MSTDKKTFDSIVIGSGMSGGWAVKELCEKGLRTLVLGYFSSEIGVTKALRHVAVPGRYDAFVPMAKGEKAWA